MIVPISTEDDYMPELLQQLSLQLIQLLLTK